MNKRELVEHTKYYNQNNVEVPSCTTIVKLLNKPELVGWANHMGFRRIDVSKFLQERASYGTICHDIAEQYLMGFVFKYPNESMPISEDQYVELLNKLRYLGKIFENSKIKILGMELQMHGKLYGGTLDLLTWQPSTNKLILFDFKSSKSVYESHLLQLGGYCLLLEELYGLSVTDIGIILLSKEYNDDNFINLFSRKENFANEEIFKKLVDIYWIKKGEYDEKK